MAKIDITAIEGYENMSADEKIAALVDYEFDTSGMVAKSALDKATSEAADWKRKYNATLTEAEQQKQADEEARKATEARLAELERKDKISTAKDQYIKSGFSAELAKVTAEAFVDGKMDIVLSNVAKHASEAATKAKDEALKGTPTPPAGGGTPTIDYNAEREKALAEGDFTKAARYARLQNEQK